MWSLPVSLSFTSAAWPVSAAADQVTVLDHFSADETAGEIRVNGMRRVDRRAAMADGPGANFVFAAGEKRDVAESFVETTGEDVDGRFRNTQGGQKLGAFGGILDLRHFRLGLGAEFADFGTRTGELRLRVFH